MRLYHAAALALVLVVSWILMAPPAMCGLLGTDPKGVLVGTWSLMLPPVVCRPNRPNLVDGNTSVIRDPCAVENTMPLYDWVVYGWFKTAQECQDVIDDPQRWPRLGFFWIIMGHGMADSILHRLDHAGRIHRIPISDFMPKSQCVDAKHDPRWEDPHFTDPDLVASPRSDEP
jgi:hypothetical protein